MIVICGVQMKDRMRAMDLTLLLNEAINQLAIGSSVCLCGYLLKG